MGIPSVQYIFFLVGKGSSDLYEREKKEITHDFTNKEITS